ncbi:MAG: ABC transporter ATP-binding protein [Phycisphaerales bacterium]|nr:ABC transporter ATP-binding protein [Phycisphaerales bacterium]
MAHKLEIGYPGRPRVLQGVSMQAMAGRVLALVGANASGKSTLLRGLAGLLPATSGSVHLDGVAVSSLPPAQRAARIGWMPQRPSIAGRFSVREVVAIGRFARPRNLEAVEEAIEAVGLQSEADRVAEELSVGQLQRVALARVLAQVPQDGILLLDEPFAPLDPAQVARAGSLVRARAKAGGIVVMAVHELRHASVLGDDVLGLRDGQVEVHGQVADTLNAKAIQRLFGVDSVDGPEGPLPAIHA